VLQIRNGAIHILDYQPNAHREKPVAQLMTHALALSQRTGLRLFDFVCAWFDEHHYFRVLPAPYRAQAPPALICPGRFALAPP
jgi:hypothetical protein